MMKILRHETGHAINYAYKLWQQKDWKEPLVILIKNIGMDTFAGSTPGRRAL